MDFSRCKIGIFFDPRARGRCKRTAIVPKANIRKGVHAG